VKPFVQLELAGQIGLPDGRYLAREGDSEHVLIVQTLGAPRPGGRRRRRPQPVDPGDPEGVPVTRVTVAAARELDGKREAEAWLEAATGDAEGRAAEVRSATRLINRALNALRAEARDPLVQDIGATRALAVRIGYGTGEQLADGSWTEARELPPPRRGRLEDVDPQTRVAAVLSGREEVHPAETLIQRARLDEQQGREAEARYGLRAARAALEEQPPSNKAGLMEQCQALEERLDSGTGPSA
jgi:hypothetical protein